MTTLSFDKLLDQNAELTAENERLRTALKEADEDLPQIKDDDQTWIAQCIKDAKDTIRAALKPIMYEGY